MIKLLVANAPCVKEAVARRASKSHEEWDTCNVNESLDNEVYGDLCARANAVFDQMKRNMPAKERLT